MTAPNDLFIDMVHQIHYGIDPGLTAGAISRVDTLEGPEKDSIKVVHSFSSKLSIQELSALITDSKDIHAYVCYEAERSFGPVDTPKTSFGIGRSFGHVEMACEELFQNGWNRSMVTTNDWQKWAWIGQSRKDKTKVRSKKAVEKLFGRRVCPDYACDAVILAIHSVRLRHPEKRLIFS